MSLLLSDMETERPNRRWRWKFATQCRLSPSLPLFELQLTMKDFLMNQKCVFWFMQVLWSIWKIWRIQNGEIEAEEAKTTAGNIKSDKDTVLVLTFVWTAVRILTACYSEPQQEVLDITRQLLAELGQHNDCEIEEKKSKLEQLKTVLEMWVTSKLGHPLNS